MGDELFERRSPCNALRILFHNQIHGFQEREGHMASSIAQCRHTRATWKCCQQDPNKSGSYLLGKNPPHKQR